MESRDGQGPGGGDCAGLHNDLAFLGDPRDGLFNGRECLGVDKGMEDGGVGDVEVGVLAFLGAERLFDFADLGRDAGAEVEEGAVEGGDGGEHPWWD